VGRVNEGTTLQAPSRIDSLYNYVNAIDSFATIPNDDLDEMDYNYAKTMAALVKAAGLIDAMINDVTNVYIVAQEDNE
jgi:hypothetical protein